MGGAELKAESDVHRNPSEPNCRREDWKYIYSATDVGVSVLWNRNV
jgi:hypothetical protein